VFERDDDTKYEGESSRGSRRSREGEGQNFFSYISMESKGERRKIGEKGGDLSYCEKR